MDRLGSAAYTGKSAALIALAMGGISACVLPPGMNAECTWPSEQRRSLDLRVPADRAHLVRDAELLEELVDRHRFHPPGSQQRCADRLVAVVGEIHSVDRGDVAHARARIHERGLDLPVRLPVAGLFALCVLFVVGRIDRRFSGEALPLAVCLVAASILLPAAFLWVGEFWTSVLQMIRVGSQHVGGRVDRLPWLQHQPQSFAVGVGLFWIIAFLRWARGGRPRTAAARNIED